MGLGEARPSGYLCNKAFPSYACSFKISHTPDVREVVRQHGGYPVSDEVCNYLYQQGLALSVTAKVTVLAGVSVAWVTISLTKLGTGVVADTYRQSTKVNTSVASQVKANDMLYEGIQEAVSLLDYSKAANEVKIYLAKRK